MKRTYLSMLAGIVALAMPLLAQAQDDVPLTATDARIKTFVYDESEVFVMTLRYGYQSNIEFGKTETVDTISVGQNYAWQIVPSGRRLFIRPLLDNVRTNMTVITNKRAYQFDLRSTPGGAETKDVVYVARFYYPDEDRPKGPSLLNPSTPLPTASAPMPAPAAPAVSSAPVASSDLMSAIPSSYNFKYTFSGPDTAAPVKIYDDGKATYFQFRDMQPNMVPSIALVSPQGKDVPVDYKLSGGYAVVNAVAPRFTLRDGKNVVCVFNEGFAR